MSKRVVWMRFADASRSQLIGGGPQDHRARQMFRGSIEALPPQFIAFLGGSEVCGRFVTYPFPDRIEQAFGFKTLNLGWSNAGLDAVLQDLAVIDLAKDAVLTVVQVLESPNLSNAFYKVHPRRNDRLTRICPALHDLYPEVDFTDVSFTGHLLRRLHGDQDPRFDQVIDALRRAWSSRMADLMASLSPPVLVVWLRREDQELSFLDRELVAAATDRAAALIEIPVCDAGGDLEGMIFTARDLPIASRSLNVATHLRIANRLMPEILPFLQKEKAPNARGTGGS